MTTLTVYACAPHQIRRGLQPATQACRAHFPEPLQVHCGGGGIVVPRNRAPLHQNPLRAKVVPTLRALDRYLWAGHSALLGYRPCPWQATGAVLQEFAPTLVQARKAYRSFVADGIPLGRRPEFQGGGLVRSLGGWRAVNCAGGGRPTSGTSGFLAVPSSWRRYVGRIRQPIRCPGAGALSQPLSPGCVQLRVVTQRTCNR